MYLARKPSHRCLSALGLLVRNSMRLMARSVQIAEKRLSARNRDVLLSAGKEQAEHLVEREFERIGTAVQRDLEGYPQLQRRLNESLIKLDEDYQNSVEIPQKLPDWGKVIKAIAGIQPKSDPIVTKLRADNMDPKQYLDRVEHWREKTVGGVAPGELLTTWSGSIKSWPKGKVWLPTPACYISDIGKCKDRGFKQELAVLVEFLF